MNRRGLTGGLALGAAVLATKSAPAQTSRPHRILVHVGGGDPALMATALHNIENAAAFYTGRGEPVAIELVANGQGFTMLRADTSPVKPLIAAVHGRFPFVVFSACQASRAGYAAAAGHDIPQVPEATDVPFGIVRLNELQEEGWSYIRA